MGVTYTVGPEKRAEAADFATYNVEAEKRAPTDAVGVTYTVGPEKRAEAVGVTYTVGPEKREEADAATFATYNVEAKR